MKIRHDNIILVPYKVKHNWRNLFHQRNV